MDEFESVTSRVMVSARLVISNAATKADAPFRDDIGALMHLTTATRPDIAHAVSYVSRIMEQPPAELCVAIKRRLRSLLLKDKH